MGKAKKLTVFEKDRIVSLQKQGLSQRAIAAKVGRSKTVIRNYLTDTEGYGSKKSSGRPTKIAPAMSLRIQDAVHQGLGLTSNQIKAVTGVKCSPVTIRRHLRRKNLKNMISSSNTSSQNCLSGLVKEEAPDIGYENASENSGEMTVEGSLQKWTKSIGEMFPQVSSKPSPSGINSEAQATDV